MPNSQFYAKLVWETTLTCECWNTLSELSAKSARVRSRFSGGKQAPKAGSKTPSFVRLVRNWKTPVRPVCLTWSMDFQSSWETNSWMTKKFIFPQILPAEIISLISLTRMYSFIYYSSTLCNSLMTPSKIILFCKNSKEIILVFYFYLKGSTIETKLTSAVSLWKDSALEDQSVLIDMKCLILKNKMRSWIENRILRTGILEKMMNWLKNLWIIFKTKNQNLLKVSPINL
jgi:hypothetical protein